MARTFGHPVGCVIPPAGAVARSRNLGHTILANSVLKEVIEVILRLCLGIGPLFIATGRIRFQLMQRNLNRKVIRTDIKCQLINVINNDSAYMDFACLDFSLIWTILFQYFG